MTKRTGTATIRWTVSCTCPSEHDGERHHDECDITKLIEKARKRSDDHT